MSYAEIYKVAKALWPQKSKVSVKIEEYLLTGIEKISNKVETKVELEPMSIRLF